MNPGSIQTTLAEAVRYARTRGDLILAEDLEAASRRIAAVLQASDELIDSASDHPTDATQHCVSTASFERLSVTLRDAGGAA